MKKLLIVLALLICTPSQAFFDDYTGKIEYKMADAGDPVITHKGSSRLGIFYIDEKIIYIQRDLSPYMFKYSMGHELAHFRWHHEMTQKEKDCYCYLYDKYGASPSKYGRTSCAENFAEMGNYIFFGFKQEHIGDVSYLHKTYQGRYLQYLEDK